MSYSKSTLSKAAQKLESRRSKAQRIQMARHLEVTEKLPIISKYENQLSETGLSVVKAIGMGSDAQEYIKQLSELNLAVQDKIKSLLKENGYPEDYLEVPYTCKNCSDTGYKGGYVCECRKELLRQLAKEELASVSESEKCRFDNFDLNYYPQPIDSVLGVSPQRRMSDILEYCKCYAEDFDTESESLYMHGATGLGKTHLSLAIANVVAENGYRVIYDTAQNILSSLEKEKFSYSGSSERENEILDCDLLIIDDLGSEFSTQFTVAAIYNIVNTRINRSKPVIISTNLTESELEAKYTQRITSRIIGNYVSLLFLGKDIRQLKNAF
ncbi:MAG: ATP-binding protein [Clostridia bacterium]|nr:ATP-binding protein [Clostridia bacterium]